MPHHNVPVVEGNGFFSKWKFNPYTIGLIPIALLNTILAVQTEHGKALERVVFFNPYDSPDYEQTFSLTTFEFHQLRIPFHLGSTSVLTPMNCLTFKLSIGYRQ